MRIVLDSNVLIAGFGGRGLCCDLWEACLGAHTVVTGPQIFEEVGRGLTSKVKLPKDRIEILLEHLREESVAVDPVEVPDSKCRDKDDNGIIGIAVAGNAEAIVTGDGDLLEIGYYRSISIITPRQFWELISKK